MNYLKSILLFTALVTLLGSCRDTSDPQDRDELSYLHQTWKHADEEDTEGRLIYRNADYKFPTSKDRQTLTFTENDVQVSVIKNNKLTQYKGSYTVVMNGNSVKELTINYTEAGQRIPTVLRYEVLILAKDALILKSL